MQFHSWKIWLLIANLNIVTQWCAENIDTLFHSIYLKWKLQQLISELLHSPYRRSPRNTGAYLEISLLNCLTTKKFHDCSRTFPKFQQNSRTFQDWWEPCHSCVSSENVKTIKLFLIKYWLHIKRQLNLTAAAISQQTE